MADTSDSTSAALTSLVNASDPQHPDSGPHPLAKATDKDQHRHWYERFITSERLEEWAAKEAYGNYTVTRAKDGEAPQKVFESMPLYTRIGMHLLYHGSFQVELLKKKNIEEILRNESIRQGKIFDDTDGALKHIEDFVETYELKDSLETLLQPDLTQYKTFNEFFYRKLKADARPAASPSDPKVVTSIADCRLTVFPSFDNARSVWVKGANFTLPNLVGDQALATSPHYANGAAVAIFRLAPADYHRYHSPAQGVLGPIKSIDGTYYTVNPQAVNEDCDVFTLNRRDVTTLNISGPAGEQPVPVIIVSIGAMLVGSIAWTKKQGDEVQKGEELGYFAYGGSTVIALFPRDLIEFDEDLLKNSENKIETIVKVGEQIGRLRGV